MKKSILLIILHFTCLCAMEFEQELEKINGQIKQHEAELEAHPSQSPEAKDILKRIQTNYESATLLARKYRLNLYNNTFLPLLTQEAERVFKTKNVNALSPEQLAKLMTSNNKLLQLNDELANLYIKERNAFIFANDYARIVSPGTHSKVEVYNPTHLPILDPIQLKTNLESYAASYLQTVTNENNALKQLNEYVAKNTADLDLPAGTEWSKLSPDRQLTVYEKSPEIRAHLQDISEKKRTKKTAYSLYSNAFNEYNRVLKTPTSIKKLSLDPDVPVLDVARAYKARYDTLMQQAQKLLRQYNQRLGQEGRAWDTFVQEANEVAHETIGPEADWTKLDEETEDSIKSTSGWMDAENARNAALTEYDNVYADIQRVVDHNPDEPAFEMPPYLHVDGVGVLTENIQKNLSEPLKQANRNLAVLQQEPQSVERDAAITRANTLIADLERRLKEANQNLSELRSATKPSPKKSNV